jgi:16S rRNA (cytosine1407-C5)-methyltransferase
LKNNQIEVSQKINDYLLNLFGKEEAAKYIEYIGCDPLTYIRINPLKSDIESLRKKLKNKYDISLTSIIDIPNGFIVDDPQRLLGKTIEHILGEFYIQSLSSMIPAIVLAPKPGETVLDLCSAPGSKSTQLAELMQNTGKLIVNEVQLDRVKTLVFNLDRMNVLNTGVIHSKGELLSKSFNNYFDKILVDAPCSGLGIMQKKGEVSSWWSQQKVESLSEVQYKLLVSAIKMLKVGGELVYSTCTMTVEENEMVIDKLLNKYPIKILPIELPVKSINGKVSFGDDVFDENLSLAKRIIPWEINSEGFFIIKLTKTDEIETKPFPGKPVREIPFVKRKALQPYFIELETTFGINKNEFDKYLYLCKGNDIFFLSKDWEDEELDYYERLGTRFGTIDKHNSIVLHTQAAHTFQKLINKNIYTITAKDELKKYLEGGTIKIDPPFRGQGVVVYDGALLGTASFSNDGIKSRFPRSKRTQEIFVNF